MSEFRPALRNPWWIPVFLGGVPDIEPRLISLLGLVSLALFFEQYDNSMLTSALKYIATDLGMAEHDLGGFLAIIRLGSLPAFLLVQIAAAKSHADPRAKLTFSDRPGGFVSPPNSAPLPYARRRTTWNVPCP